MNRERLDIDLIDHCFDRQSWHGPTLRGAIRGVTAKQAAWRPAPNRHNIHEIVVHAAYWKYAVWRRLTGSARGSFPRTGSNWFPASGSDRKSWTASVALLGRCHDELRTAVAGLPARKLLTKAPGGTISFWRLVSGIAVHDIYHAGQIQLLKKLQR